MTSPALPPVRFLRVLGHRSYEPAVLAVVDDEHLVRWKPEEAWTCTCEAEEGAACEHATLVAALTHPRVTGAEQ